jgi:hypothetical protein
MIGRVHLSRVALPVALIVLGVWLTSGCIYIPTFGILKSGENAAKKVGDEKSAKPIRVRNATRADVLRILGPPYAQKLDGSALAYAWHIRNALVIWPLCFQASSVNGVRTLVLRFNAQGALMSYQVLSEDDTFVFQADPPPLPGDIPEPAQAPHTDSGTRVR